MKMLSYMLATAGHVDHGKSALVKALSGIDPDRLPEEKARGITIDLGFAHLQVPSPRDKDVTYRVGIVDVPGHEDFVKNMVAGMGSIDVALLVVAADDGWMPQTEEHLQILTYLGVTRGVVALTKSDLADSVDAIEMEVREKLRGSALADAPIVRTSVVSQKGLDELRTALGRVLDAAPLPRDFGKPRLPVDRAFVLKGVGTVVTGTLSGGTIRRGQSVMVQPSGRNVKVRSVQTHNHEVEIGSRGSRVALNLPDLHVDDGAGAASETTVWRGDVITLAELGKAAQTIDVLLERSARDQGARPLKDGAMVHVHHGSGDAAGQVRLIEVTKLEAGERALAQLRLDRGVLAFVGDRLIVRDWPAQHTLAGGLVLDPEATRGGLGDESRRAFLARRAESPEDLAQLVMSQVVRDGATRRGELLVKSRFSAAQIVACVEDLQRTREVVLTQDWVVDTGRWATIVTAAGAAIDREHRARPNAPGLSLADLRTRMEKKLPAGELFDALFEELGRSGFVRSGSTIRQATHRPALPANLVAAEAKVRAALAAKPLEPPSRKEIAPDARHQEALRFLIDTGEVVSLGEDLVLLSGALQKAVEAIRQLLTQRGQATVSEMRQLLGTTRRIMMPLVDYLDRQGVTARRGDFRELRVRR